MRRLFAQQGELIERHGQDGKARLAEAAAAFGIELGTIKTRVAALETQTAQRRHDHAKLASLEKKMEALDFTFTYRRARSRPTLSGGP